MSMVRDVPRGWWNLTDGDQLRHALEEELDRENSPGHLLAATRHDVVARCEGCDDVVVQVSEDQFAVVHLTWTRQRSPEPGWPRTRLFISWEMCVQELIEHTEQAH
jgi:hypothetical protein